ncbi:hypothetical protein EJB05_05194, partial [Eragrostis curvula]
MHQQPLSLLPCAPSGYLSGFSSDSTEVSRSERSDQERAQGINSSTQGTFPVHPQILIALPIASSLCYHCMQEFQCKQITFPPWTVPHLRSAEKNEIAMIQAKCDNMNEDANSNVIHSEVLIYGTPC